MSAGWRGSNRRSRLPANWPAIRKQRLEMDNYRCQFVVGREGICGAPANEVDHKNAMTDDHSLHALQSLCSPHHRMKSAREGAAAMHAARRRKKAEFARHEPHPGELVAGARDRPLPYPWELSHAGD